MAWEIKITNEVPRVVNIDGRDQTWSSWTYNIKRQCWNIENESNKDLIDGAREPIRSPQINSREIVDLNTDTCNDLRSCHTKDKYLDIALVFCNSAGHHLFTHYILFKVTGGSFFSHYHYYVNGNLMGHSYFENSSFHTDIVIVNEKETRVNTWKID